jgi:PadR family transcriptional regulator, regulatory protein AphA
MSLKYAILGFLRTTPRSGYDLARRFKDTMGGLVWMAGLSQIYPELRRLEQGGFIVEEAVKEGRPGKRVYRLTGAGRRELEHWVKSDLDSAPVRDAQRLQFLLLDSSPIALIRKHLLRHRAHYERRLESLRDKLKGLSAQTNPLLKARLAVRPKKEHAVIVAVRRAALEGDVRRAQLEIDWVDCTIKEIETAGRRAGSRSAALRKKKAEGGGRG